MDGLIAYALSKKYADEVGQSILDAGFKTQVEQDRSILQTVGQEKILYFIPKTTAKPSDGYDEYVYSNNAWEQVGATDVDLSSYATKAEVGNLANLPTTDKSSIVSAISETFTSVSNGKSLVASAITDKGVSTSSGATFEIMAQNIEAIPTGSDFDMTVTANQIKMIIEVFDFDLSFWTRFGISGGGAVTVDWGDGTVDEFTSNAFLEYAPQRKHNYQKAGKYLVMLTISDGILSIGSINNYCVLSEGELSGNNINQNDEIRRAYNYKLKEISIGDHVTVWGGLRNVPFLKIHTDINYWLYGTSTDYIKIKNGFTVFEEYSFMSVYAYKIKMPFSVTTFSSSSFANSKIRIIDFTDISLNENNELPITFASTNVFSNASASMILLFATQEIAEVAKTTTNLSQLASQIKYVGEV